MGGQRPEPGLPGSPSPWNVAPGNNELGPTYGNQSKESWLIGQVDSRPILDSNFRPPALWRATAFGENVTLTVRYGPKCTKVLTGLQPPLRAVFPGLVQIEAVPVDPSLPAHAECTLTMVSSGLGESDCRKLVTVAGAFSPDATRFRATVASIVSIGGIVNCSLAVAQSIPLIAGSSLTSGAGFLEFDT